MMFKHYVVKNSGCVTVIDYPNGSYNAGKKCVFMYKYNQYEIESTENRTRLCLTSSHCLSLFLSLPYKLSHLFDNYWSWYVFNIFYLFFVCVFSSSIYCTDMYAVICCRRITSEECFLTTVLKRICFYYNFL